MSHIKMFENFKIEYYIEISNNEFDELIGDFEHHDDKWDLFDKEELMEILSYFPNCDYELAVWSRTRKSNGKKWLEIFNEHWGDFSISIYKIIDDWWGVYENHSPHKFYKCDQFEGLIKLLSDKKYFQK